MTPPRWHRCTWLAAALLAAPAAHAGDTWTNIRPGVDYLHRTTSGPQDIYAARIDLTVPNVGIHASADAMGTERHVTTPTFASSADVLVAINGDWSDATTPVGLAISDGAQWHDHIHDDSLGSTWGYFACTATKTCTIGVEQALDVAWWFTTPTAPPYRYFQAIGANGLPLITDGVPNSGCYDSSQYPRSAICLEADGTTLWLVVIDGRTSSAAGMTCDQTRDLLLGFDCWSAAMLDGGGSSTLVIEDDVKNNPSDGSPRTVANHLGIVYSDALDPACTVASGKWCDGTTLSVCQGGRFIASGDCAAYGATCEENGDNAYCVDYRCPGGSGSGAVCLDATHLAACSDGTYGEGDCGAFGLVCGTDASGAACMDSRCEGGPNTAFCTDSGLYAACTAGAYAEQDCTASGMVCWEGAGTAACMDPRCTAGPDAQVCSEAGVLTGCTGGVYGEQDCAAAGLACDPAAGCVDPGAGDSGQNVAPPGDRTAIDEAGACGCAALPGPDGLLALVGVAFMARRRRRPGA